jgi:hypothetical protein
VMEIVSHAGENVKRRDGCPPLGING